MSAAKTQLKERKQVSGETLLAYYDMIVDYLKHGIRNKLKLHVKRRLKMLNDELTPALFLKIARDEEKLQNEVSSETQRSVIPLQPYFFHITTATGKPLHKPETSIHLKNPEHTQKRSRPYRSRSLAQYT